MRTKHKRAAKEGHNYLGKKRKCIDNELVSVSGQKTPRKIPRRKTAVIDCNPEMQYIDVPAVIRIPLVMGPIQIVSLDKEPT
jgi:hypothetical protein